MRQVPLWPYFGVIALDAVGFSMVAPLMAPLLLPSHPFFAQYLWYGVVLAVFPLAYMIASPILGNLSDHFGRKPILLFCVLGTLLAWLSYCLSLILGNFSLLLAGRLLSGVTSANQAIAQAAMADLGDQQHKAQNLSSIAIAMSAGLVLGPLCTALLSTSASHSHLRLLLPFLGAILLSLVNLWVVLRYLKETAPAEKEALSFHLASQYIWQDSLLRRYFLIFFGFELAWSLYYQALPALLLVHFHQNLSQLSFFLALIGLILCFHLWAGVRLGLRFLGLNRMTHGSLCLGVLGLLGAFLGHNLTLQLLAAIFITLSVAGGYTGLLTLLSNRLGSHQGVLMGYSDALLALAFALTGLLTGVLGHFSLFQASLFAAIFMGISAIIFVR